MPSKDLANGRSITARYNIMLHCWSEGPSERQKFSQLHKVFDRFLGIHIQDRYPYIEIQNQPSRFDRLAPEMGQGTSGEKELGEDNPVTLSEDEDEGEEINGVKLKL